MAITRSAIAGEVGDAREVLVGKATGGDECFDSAVGVVLFTDVAALTGTCAEGDGVTVQFSSAEGVCSELTRPVPATEEAERIVGMGVEVLLATSSSGATRSVEEMIATASLDRYEGSAGDSARATAMPSIPTITIGLAHRAASHPRLNPRASINDLHPRPSAPLRIGDST